MQSFKYFMVEEVLSKQNLERLMIVFKKIAEKELKTKLYRYGGPDGIVHTTKGFGILFFHHENKALRINVEKGEIVSLTLWDAYKLGHTGDYTVDLGGLSLFQAKSKIIQLIKKPKAGVIETYPEVLDESYIVEATRVKPADFVDSFQKANSSARLNSVSWEDIYNFALSKDIQIPSVIRQTAQVPGTKGKNIRFDLTKFISRGAADVGNDSGDGTDKGKSELQYFIKVTARDPNSNKFLSVKDDAKAAAMLGKISGAVNNPDVTKEMKDPDSLFGIMSNLVQIVCRKSRNALIVYGGPGIGKTFVVTKTIAEEGLVKNKDWFIVKGKISTASLYQTLFLHREGSLLVFDDTDSIWGDADAANILKAALDSYDERVISWISGRTVNVSRMSDEDKLALNQRIEDKLMADPDDRSIKFPSEFEFKGQIIFISNLAYEKFDSAVLTRSAKIDMTLTTDQIFHRMGNLLADIGDKDVPMTAKKEILDFLKGQSSKGIITDVSMRTYVSAEGLYKSGLPNWKDLLDYT